MTAYEFDDSHTRYLERLYATPDVVAQRAATLALLAPAPGERILDVGSGPGFLLEQLGAAVGPEGEVVGVEPSAPMNIAARARCAEIPQVRIVEGDALAIPLPDAAVDVAVSTQVYEYVADMPAAMAELRRVVRPGGRVLILDTDWDSLVWHVADRERQRRIIAAWDEHLADPHLPATLAGHLRRAGFRVTGTHAHPILNDTWDENTFGHGTARNIAAFVPGRQGLTGADAEAWLADLRARDADGEYLFSLNRYCVLAAG
jgi:arsenite methyltransferase